MPNSNYAQNFQYAKNINFGKNINQNINRSDDPQNPLTSCIFGTLGTNFLHGPTSRNYKPYCSECSNYMADRCSGTYNQSEAWDDKCSLYMAVNTDTIWPNTAAVNQTAATILPKWRKPRTVGEQLLRNSLERRFIVYPDTYFRVMQFDPNIANSPYYRQPCNSCVDWNVRYIDARTIDNDPVMNAALDNFSACVDVFAIIWQAWKNGKLSIKGTRLEQNLHQNTALYNDIYGRIVANMSQTALVRAAIGTCHKQSASTVMMPDYSKGVPNCNK